MPDCEQPECSTRKPPSFRSAFRNLGTGCLLGPSIPNTTADDVCEGCQQCFGLAILGILPHGLKANQHCPNMVMWFTPWIFCKADEVLLSSSAVPGNDQPIWLPILQCFCCFEMPEEDRARHIQSTHKCNTIKNVVCCSMSSKHL